MSYAFSKTLNFQYACYRNCISYILMYYTLIYIFNCIRDKYRKGVTVLVWKEFGIVKTGTVSLWDWVGGGKKTPSVLGHLCNKSSQGENPAQRCATNATLWTILVFVWFTYNMKCKCTQLLYRSEKKTMQLLS